MLWKDYKMMQFMRMGIYDFSDIAYDTFLMNGHPTNSPFLKKVNVGDTVRLRVIGASANTFFKVKIPGSTLNMVHVQGNDVKPHPVKDFFIGPGETYDVLVKIQENKPYIIYAESFDKVGQALGALVTDPNQKINFSKVTPFPEPKPATRTKMKNEK